jgi:transposase
MLTSFEGVTVHLAGGATDMRKSIDGLAALVSQVFQLDPFSPSLFVFCNRDRNKLKILYWEHNGFWLFYRRLERGRFRWPTATADQRPLAVSQRQLRWLLDGLAIEQRLAHHAVTARTVI